MELKIMEWNINQRMNYSNENMPNWIATVIIPQPRRGAPQRCPVWTASLVWSEFWRLLRLHGYFFIPNFYVGWVIALKPNDNTPIPSLIMLL